MSMKLISLFTSFFFLTLLCSCFTNDTPDDFSPHTDIYSVQETPDSKMIKLAEKEFSGRFSYGIGLTEHLTISQNAMEAKGVFFTRSADEYGLLVIEQNANNKKTKATKYPFAEKEMSQSVWREQELPTFSKSVKLDSNTIRYSVFPYCRRGKNIYIGFYNCIDNPLVKASRNIELLSFRIATAQVLAVIVRTKDDSDVSCDLISQNGTKYSIKKEILEDRRVRFIFGSPNALSPNTQYQVRLYSEDEELVFGFKTPALHPDAEFCYLPLEADRESSIALPDDPEEKVVLDITHPSVLYLPKKWNGYQIWLAATPYPTVLKNYSIKGYTSGEALENTHIFFQKRSGNIFQAIPDNPIIRKPLLGFNSDSELVFDGKYMYAMTRNRYGIAGKSNVFYVQKSADGVIWSSPVPVLSTGNGESGTHSVSPALLYRNNKFMCYIFEPEADPKSIKSIDLYEADSLTKSYSMKKIHSGSWDKTELSPWHGDVFVYQEKAYMIFSTISSFLYLAESEDFINWKVYPAPLASFPSFYRPTAYIDEDNCLVVYSSCHNKFVDYAPDHYPSGNNIIRIDFGSFEKMLKQLQMSEK